MRIRYFAETDTAVFEFSDHVAVETKEVSEDVYLDLDAEGAVVSMTVERAEENARVSEVAFLRIERWSPDLVGSSSSGA